MQRKPSKGAANEATRTFTKATKDLYLMALTPLS